MRALNKTTMARYYTESGYTRGGLDVSEAVNLVFKGLLLSPIFMLCIFVTIAMLKHMIFGGVPTMHQPTEQQQQQIREESAQINVVPPASQPEVVIEQPVQETVEGVPEALPSQPNGLQVVRPTVQELPTVYSLGEETWNTQIQESPFQ